MLGTCFPDLIGTVCVCCILRASAPRLIASAAATVPMAPEEIFKN
jgi:hypothetical protein